MLQRNYYSLNKKLPSIVVFWCTDSMFNDDELEMTCFEDEKSYQEWLEANLGSHLDTGFSVYRVLRHKPRKD